MEGKGDVAKMFAELKKDIKDIKQSEKNMESRWEQRDKKLDLTVNEMKAQIKDVSKRTQNLEERLKPMQRKVRNFKKEGEKNKSAVSELNKEQKELWDAIVVQELKQREINLRIRSLPETAGQNILEELIIEIAQWQGIAKDEFANTVLNAFRIKVKSKKGKKFPGDCLMIFKDKQMRNLILLKK